MGDYMNDETRKSERLTIECECPECNHEFEKDVVVELEIESRVGVDE